MSRRLLVLLLLLAPVTAWAQTPPAGFTTITAPDWTQAGGIATAGASFGYLRWNTAYGPNQQAGCIISALPNEGDTLHILFRFEDMANRMRLILTRVAGSNNDTVTLGEVVGGVDKILQGPISLGKDIQVLDRVGIDIVGPAIKGNYWSTDSAWNEWRTIVTGSATRTPAASYIGLGGAAPVACTQFFGQGDAVASVDTTPPSAPTNLVVTRAVGSSPTASDVRLAWDASTDLGGSGIQGYRIEQGDAACNYFSEIARTNGTALTVLGSNIPFGESRCYRVRAIDVANNLGAYSLNAILYPMSGGGATRR